MAAKLTKQHKKALAEGRRQGRVVRDYLQALQRDAAGRVDPDSLRQRIDQLQTQITQETNPVKRVELIQRRLDGEQQLAHLDEQPDVAQLERDFVAVVNDYSQRKDISYWAWREAGVPASILREAGIARTRRPVDA